MNIENFTFPLLPRTFEIRTYEKRAEESSSSTGGSVAWKTIYTRLRKMDIGMSPLKSPGFNIIGRVVGIIQKDIPAAVRKTTVLS